MLGLKAGRRGMAQGPVILSVRTHSQPIWGNHSARQQQAMLGWVCVSLSSFLALSAVVIKEVLNECLVVEFTGGWMDG